MSNEQFKAQIAVTFLARSQKMALLTDHVSARGVFVRTDSPPRMRELVRMEFVLPPSGKAVVMHGAVTKVVLLADNDGAPGVEIAFFAKAGDAGGLWDQFIEYVRVEHPAAREIPIVLTERATDQTRRAHPRRAAAPSILVVPSDGDAVLSLGDISAGGMFLKTEQDFVVGADLRVTLLSSRTSARLRLDCIVRRRTSGSDAGIGVEFRNMTDETRAELSEFLHLAENDDAAPSSEKIFAPRAQVLMNTLPGSGAARYLPSVAPSAAAWASLDEGWSST
jgi:PilZ domain